MLMNNLKKLDYIDITPMVWFMLKGEHWLSLLAFETS
jgi:hypothetical protein